MKTETVKELRRHFVAIAAALQRELEEEETERGIKREAAPRENSESSKRS